MEQQQSIISKAHGNNKVIDIRDNLRIPESYAEIKSGGIPIYLCDYTKGKGDSAITVKAQIEPFRFKVMKEVVVKNLGKVVLPTIGVLSETMSMMMKVYFQEYSLMNSIMEIAREEIKGNLENEKDKLKAIGISLKEAKEISDSTEISPFGTQDFSYDYEYNQERVNPYKETNGYCPVSSLYVTRHGYRNDGMASNYPWYIKITNFEAQKQQAEGKISYDSKTKRNIKEAYINISDDDMYRLCDDAEQFVDIWSCSNSVKLVKAATDEKNAYIAKTRGGTR